MGLVFYSSGRDDRHRVGIRCVEGNAHNLPKRIKRSTILAVNVHHIPINQSINPVINQSINQSNNQSSDQSINQSINQSIEKSINQSINRLINQSINQSSDQSINQSIEQSIDRLINRSINQSRQYDRLVELIVFCQSEVTDRLVLMDYTWWNVPGEQLDRVNVGNGQCCCSVAVFSVNKSRNGQVV